MIWNIWQELQKLKKIKYKKKKKKRKKKKKKKKKFRVEKVINKENDKLHVKWEVYDHSLNSWIDKKDII